MVRALLAFFMSGAISLAAPGCECGGPEAIDSGSGIDSGAFDGGGDSGGDSGRTDVGRFDGGNIDGGPGDAGSDAGPSCLDTMCGADCADLDTSPTHCGSCDNDCTAIAGVDPDAVTCVAGMCNLTGACIAGRADCTADEGCETDIGTAAHCGACDVACDEPTPLCASGASGASCVAGCDGATPTRCDSSCVDTTSSTAHCGGCGMACTDPANGTPACTDSACEVLCDAGFHACGDACPADDDATACGATCEVCVVPAHASAVCNTGTCGFVCLPDFGDCDGIASNGCEVDLRSDAAHCGSCAGACALTNATATCVDSLCAVAACNPLTGDCNGLAADGCEANLATEVNHCGMCGALCALDNAAESCGSGLCMLGACESGFDSCDANASNGCETETNASLTDCGGCGNVCDLASASESCVSGTCTLGACTTGFGNCDGVGSNGCEVNTETSPSHCGTCGNVCNLPNSTESCVSGACNIASCDADYADCDASRTNGCEVNTATSAANCGTCGRVCVAANGTPSCSAGNCAVDACNAGFADCDALATNGCETNTQTSASSCGTCGNVCNLPNAVPMCTAGMCAIATCNAGFSDCDGIASNGCEVNTTTSPTHCGMCGRTCNLPNATASCTSGACTIGTCNAGFADCNSNPIDGCEINTRTSVNNCGVCGMTCFAPNGTPMCAAGMCAIAACNGGFGNCNGSAGDGCEVNLTNNLNNCGVCGNNCASTCSSNVAATTCSSGACAITGCTATHLNVDGVCANGCECALPTVSSVCAAPASLGTLNIGQTQSASSNLVPLGREAWYQVTFVNNTNPGYHPRVRFTSNPGTAYRFDVLSSCSGSAISCGEGGNSSSVTDWETFYTDYRPPVTGFIPEVGSGGTIWIRVFRRAGLPATCDQYTLTVSN